MTPVTKGGRVILVWGGKKESLHSLCFRSHHLAFGLSVITWCLFVPPYGMKALISFVRAFAQLISQQCVMNNLPIDCLSSWWVLHPHPMVRRISFLLAAHFPLKEEHCLCSQPPVGTSHPSHPFQPHSPLLPFPSGIWKMLPAHSGFCPWITTFLPVTLSSHTTECSLSAELRIFIFIPRKTDLG